MKKPARKKTHSERRAELRQEVERLAARVKELEAKPPLKVHHCASCGAMYRWAFVIPEGSR